MKLDYLRRPAGFALMNVSVLATGVAACLLIFLVVRYEPGYNTFYARADRICQVNHH